MNIIIILFGLLIIVMAGIMAVRPKLFADTMLQYFGSVWLHVCTGSVR